MAPAQGPTGKDPMLDTTQTARDPLLWNPDIAPLPRQKRDWTWITLAAVWMGMVHNVVAYEAAAGLMAIGFSAMQCLLIVWTAYCSLFVAMWFNARAGTEWGIPFCVLIRAAFGPRGAVIPVAIRAVVAIFWFSVQSYAASQALDAIAASLWPDWSSLHLPDGTALGPWLAVTMIWGLHALVAAHGIHRIRNFELVAGPLVLVVAGAAALWAIRICHGTGPLFAIPSTLHGSALFLKGGAAVTSIIGIWASFAVNIPDLSRFVRSQRDQAIGQLIGLPVTAVIFTPMSILITSATLVMFGKPIWNPVEILMRIHNTPLTLAGGITIIVAALSVNVAGNIVPAAYDLLSLFPRRLDFDRAGITVILLGLFVAPWLWFDHPQTVFALLGLLSAVLAPITGIMLADYYLVRRQTIDLAQLYSFSGLYAGRRGWRPSALAATGLTLLLLLPPALLPAGTLPGQDAINAVSWFLGIATGALLYTGFNRHPLHRPNDL
ncbi:putative allantoin permease [Gluconacetobacter diazotrophicus PA1 5]|uniref:Putative allantoin permease n=2 Tax=Gluconacetobacter diazotrophicus TaxID=33996 RepID=A9HCT5_GLUDA|nr:putative allantoin permease [Gluconacetobacter diazotrophicus PA1 5]